MDVIDYEILGSDMQFVELELDPGEAAVGEAGTMMYMQDGIQMDTVFGDGSQQQGGFFGKLLGAGKRLVTGSRCSPRSSTTRRMGSGASPSPPRTPGGSSRSS